MYHSILATKTKFKISIHLGMSGTSYNWVRYNVLLSCDESKVYHHDSHFMVQCT